jgi:hypothetical protein
MEPQTGQHNKRISPKVLAPGTQEITGSLHMFSQTLRAFHGHGCPLSSALGWIDVSVCSTSPLNNIGQTPINHQRSPRQADECRITELG